MSNGGGLVFSQALAADPTQTISAASGYQVGDTIRIYPDLRLEAVMDVEVARVLAGALGGSVARRARLAELRQAHRGGRSWFTITDDNPLRHLAAAERRALSTAPLISPVVHPPHEPINPWADR